MLYYDFKDYEGFKELFGIIEHGNGVKSRKNKILLSLYKEKAWLKRHIIANSFRSAHSLYLQFDRREDRMMAKNDKVQKNYRRCSYIRACYYGMTNKTIYEDCEIVDALSITDMAGLKRWVYDILDRREFRKNGACFRLKLNGRTFYSDTFETDDMNGLCEDGTLNAIRYHNISKGRVFKMKAGKMFNHILSCKTITDGLPEQVKRWMGEEFVADWVEYAREKLSDSGYVLHVDDDFCSIYSRKRCKGYEDGCSSFASCMAGQDQWQFYRDSVKAKAAYLTDEDDKIVARCILFTHVEDEDGRVWRLAERQYAAHEDDTLKRQLVSALIREGHIDGYKRVGSSCHDARAFVDNGGNSLADKHFCIACTLDYGDTLSYQDSFKWYDIDRNIAYNYENCDCTIHLDTTSSSIEDEDNHEYESWSSYNDEWIDNDSAYYVDTRDDHFYDYQTVAAYVYNSHTGTYREECCFNEDCIEIDGDYYYAGENGSYPEDYGISECPECGSYFVIGRTSSYYSELTEEDYCCTDCLEEAEKAWHKNNGDVYSEFDHEWFDEDDVITAKEWCVLRYWETTISIDSFNERVEEGTATEYNGVYYLDEVMYDGEPAHLGQDRLVA